MRVRVKRNEPGFPTETGLIEVLSIRGKDAAKAILI